MDFRKKYSEEYLVSSLTVQESNYHNAHHFEVRSRKIHNSFGYIISGSVEFTTLDEKIYAGEGDVLFIPEGIRYLSHWEGTPQIRFLSVHFLTNKTVPSPWRSMQLQVLPREISEKMAGLFEQLCEQTNDKAEETLQAYGLFYQLSAVALPYMRAHPVKAIPPAVKSAISYMEANYATIASVKEIASACYISQSRLYHLFQEHLELTPISYLNKLRIQKAMELLEKSELSIQQIAEQLNFHSEYYFRKAFRKATGVLPSHFRKML